MERKVKTMSGKPHTPRELIADKDITPQEAMHRKMMRLKWTIVVSVKKLPKLLGAT